MSTTATPPPADPPSYPVGTSVYQELFSGSQTPLNKEKSALAKQLVSEYRAPGNKGDLTAADFGYYLDTVELQNGTASPSKQAAFDKLNTALSDDQSAQGAVDLDTRPSDGSIFACYCLFFLIIPLFVAAWLSSQQKKWDADPKHSQDKLDAANAQSAQTHAALEQSLQDFMEAK